MQWIDENQKNSEKKKIKKKLKGNSDSYSLSQSNYSSINNNYFTGQRVKPRFMKLFNLVICSNLEGILNYLDLLDLCVIRSLNKQFLFSVHNYYQKRLKFEINLISKFQEQNQDKVEIYMKNIDSQIPLSNKNWLDFDLKSVTEKLQILDRNTLTKIRAIKSIGKLSDIIYAPFCMIFGQNKNSNVMTKNNTWKTTATKILNDPSFLINLSNFDLENMSDSEVLSIFIYLNLPELNIDLINKFSSDFAKLIIWCQAVVSYHILIHPYTYRNEKSVINYGGNVYEFAKTMNYKINRFYKFKRLLYNLNIIKVPLADYVFNLQHKRETPKKDESLINLLSPKHIGIILSFLPINNSYKLMTVNKKFHKAFTNSINLNLLEILKEIYFFKSQGYEKLVNSIPVIYSHSIFSPYFLMLDDILNSQCNESGFLFVPFLSKEQLNDIKNLKIKSKDVYNIAKIFCIICDLKVNKKVNEKGEIEILYLDKLKLLVINGKVMKLMRKVDKLGLNEKKINIISNELKQYCSIKKLNEIKKMNHGIFQLLLWELFVLAFLKSFNPFYFISFDYISKRYEQEEVDLVKYYIEILNYLKYNLKIKYHFHNKIDLSDEDNQKNNSKNIFNNNIYPNYSFNTLISDLNSYLLSQNIENEGNAIWNSSNISLIKIASAYFKSKDLIPLGAKPILYERIMMEIITSYESEIQSLDYKEQNNNGIDTSKQIESENKNNDNIQTNNTKQSNIPKLKQSKIKTAIKSNILFIKNNDTDKPNLSNIPKNIIIKYILFYLDINCLPNVALVNKKMNDCLKTHIFIRLLFLNKEKRIIEQENSELISEIEEKRNNFFEEYEMQPPRKEHAYSLMNQITNNDIMEIKQCLKKYNKHYEKIITPLLLLFDEKPKVIYKSDGTKTTSYYQTAKIMLFKPNFTKRIKDLELETIPVNIFTSVENMIESNTFNEQTIKSLSPCFIRLINWIKGVIECHRVLRKFCLSSYDYEILNENEIEFCKEMDKIILLYYKILRYASKYCKNYESDAQKIMEELNIQIN